MRHTFRHGSAALALVLAACGGEAETASAGGGDRGRLDVCGLATPAEVATIVGAPSVDTSGKFTEHSHTSPPTYSASCFYAAEGAVVMVVVHYPVRGSVPSADELASSVTDHIRSQEESDPAIAEMYRRLQVTPVPELPAPAAEYEIAGTTTLEARVGDRTVQVNAGSSDIARRVARRLIERLG
ncbi:MAG TPA: hypothetical protein VK922_03870 [Gemmatimonadaceae bacterium]|nr:hypothetical protein [Gemmatimonadaceae bacterium]